MVAGLKSVDIEQANDLAVSTSVDNVRSLFKNNVVVGWRGSECVKRQGRLEVADSRLQACVLSTVSCPAVC